MKDVNKIEALLEKIQKFPHKKVNLEKHLRMDIIKAQMCCSAH